MPALDYAEAPHSIALDVRLHVPLVISDDECAVVAPDHVVGLCMLDDAVAERFVCEMQPTMRKRRRDLP